MEVLCESPLFCMAVLQKHTHILDFQSLVNKYLWCTTYLDFIITFLLKQFGYLFGAILGCNLLAAKYWPTKTIKMNVRCYKFHPLSEALICLHLHSWILIKSNTAAYSAIILLTQCQAIKDELPE